MKYFDLSDAIRSIVLGQAAAMILIVASYTWLLIKLKHLRPGAILGVSCVGLSNVAAALFVCVIMIERIGTIPIDYHTWIASIAILAGNLGFSLLCAHLILHDDRLRERITHWFGHKDKIP